MSTFKVPFLASVRKSYKVAAFALGAVVLFGCPVYSGSEGDVVCDSQGNCCDSFSGNCSQWNCDYDDQCPYGASCSSQGFCTSGGGASCEEYGDCGGDGGYTYDAGTYDAGYGYDSGADATTDCSTTGCPTGQICLLSDSVASCVTITTSNDAGVDATKPSADTGAPDSGPAPDAGSGDAGHDAGHDTGPVYPPFTGCTTNSECAAGDAGAGALCLDGKCVSIADQCFDSTQCVAGEDCVQGVCTPTCGANGSCPAGYSCNTAANVCSGNPTPCGVSDGGAVCATGTTCVEQHCVPICFAPDGGDAAAQCAAGELCVDHGCVPNQAPILFCAGSDGQQSSCATGSICLHHNCYIACTPGDAGADAGGSCRTADNFNECKPVTTSTGTFHVCGSATNLGNECNPTAGINCMGSGVCIDGFCE